MKETLSRNRLTKAYLELASTKSPEEIKITELCQCAGVPRSTFYNSFQNMVEMEQYVQDYVIRLGEDCFKDPDIEKCITDFLTTIRSHDHIYRSLLFTNSKLYSGEQTVFSGFMQNSIDSNLQKVPSITSDDQHLHTMRTQFFTYGVLAIIRYWMSIDYTVPVAKVRDLIISLPKDF